jgi:hypothetical protein
MNKQRPKMFVGSSLEGLHIAKAIQANLDHNCEITIWSQGVFGLGEGTIETLVDRLDDFDFASLVLTPDDLIKGRKGSSPSPRDNVLLELGLFIGRLGRKRTFIVYDRTTSLRLPSDLAGVTSATFQPHASENWQAALGAACTQIETALRALGTRNQIEDTVEKLSCRVEIYYHKHGFTKDQADWMVRKLNKYGVKSIILEHAIPDVPDAIFIGSYVRAADARFVLSLLPYEVKYLFRPDYPESEGGDLTGLKIGIGYISGYNADNLNKRSEPIRITKGQLAELKNPKKTDTEFQCLLHRITKSYETI